MIIVKKGKILFFIIAITLLHALGYSDSDLGIMPFVNGTSDTTVSNLHVKLFKRLQFEQLPGGTTLYLVDKENCESCITFVNGSVEMVGTAPFLKLVISDRGQTGQELKVLPLSGYSLDDVIDLCVLKIRHFLQQKHAVKVRVSSMPLDCEMYLNGIKVGKTPAELVLERGVYRLTLEHEFCRAFHDSIEISMGTDIDIDATLEFTGYRYRPFLYSSVFFTVSTTVFWILEEHYHREYGRLKSGTPTQVFTDQYNKYRALNYARIGLFNGAILSWSVTGYFTFKNFGLKKKLFTKP